MLSVESQASQNTFSIEGAILRIERMKGVFSKDPSGPEVPTLPVLHGEPLDIDLPPGTGRVNKLAVSDVDPDMKGLLAFDLKKDEVCRRKSVWANRSPRMD